MDLQLTLHKLDRFLREFPGAFKTKLNKVFDASVQTHFMLFVHAEFIAEFNENAIF